MDPQNQFFKWLKLERYFFIYQLILLRQIFLCSLGLGGATDQKPSPNDPIKKIFFERLKLRASCFLTLVKETIMLT